MNDFGIKELYSVTLRPTSDIEINGVQYLEDEPIISFDKIQVSYLNENKRRVNAHGGYGDPVLVYWEETRSLSIQFSEGVISKEGMSILSNSKILKRNSKPILIPYSEIVKCEFDGDKQYLQSKFNIHSKLFIKSNGKNIAPTMFDIAQKRIYIEDAGADEDTEYALYYNYLYSDDSDLFTIGQRAIKGFLKLTARARVKDDQTGKESTALFEIPKLQLTSDLTMRLGSKVSPYIYSFNALGHPVGDRSTQHVFRITFLDRDIDADF